MQRLGANVQENISWVRFVLRWLSRTWSSGVIHMSSDGKLQYRTAAWLLAFSDFFQVTVLVINQINQVCVVVPRKHSY